MNKTVLYVLIGVIFILIVLGVYNYAKYQKSGVPEWFLAWMGTQPSQTSTQNVPTDLKNPTALDWLNSVTNVLTSSGVLTYVNGLLNDGEKTNESGQTANPFSLVSGFTKK